MTKTLVCRLDRLYQRLVKVLSLLQSPLLLALRLFWGWQFFQTGWGKLHNIPDVTEFFTSLGIPFPMLNAYFIATLECVGGLLLFFGLGSRLISLLFIGNMTVAYLTADIEAVRNAISDPDGFINATPFHFLLTSLIVAAFGPGFFSIDRIIRAVFDKKVSQPNLPSDASHGGTAGASPIPLRRDA